MKKKSFKQFFKESIFNCPDGELENHTLMSSFLTPDDINFNNLSRLVDLGSVEIENNLNNHLFGLIPANFWTLNWKQVELFYYKKLSLSQVKELQSRNIMVMRVL